MYFLQGYPSSVKGGTAIAAGVVDREQQAVTIRELTPLEKASNESWLYRVTLEIGLGDPEWCVGFTVGGRFLGDTRARSLAQARRRGLGEDWVSSVGVRLAESVRPRASCCAVASKIDNVDIGRE